MNDWGIVNTATLYNDAGNQVKLPTVAGTALHPVVYDFLNRLTAVRNAADTQNTGTFDYDALGRRVLFYDNKTPEFSRWYYYDGVNEILEAADSGATVLRWYVHGLSYIDERLMMHAEYDPTGENEVNKSYYYAIDRMYNVRYLLDSAGAIVESYAYDPYGKPLIRECAGRGDMTGDSIVSKDGDEDAFLNAMSCTTFDPRADVDDDGDVDRDDAALYDAKIAIWDGTGPTDVKTARSLIGNPYMFQGRPHFVAWTDYVAEHATLMLNDHRNRFADPMTGRWLTRDPEGFVDAMNLYDYLGNNPSVYVDPEGTLLWEIEVAVGVWKGYKSWEAAREARLRGQNVRPMKGCSKKDSRAKQRKLEREVSGRGNVTRHKAHEDDVGPEARDHVQPKNRKKTKQRIKSKANAKGKPATGKPGDGHGFFGDKPCRGSRATKVAGVLAVAGLAASGCEVISTFSDPESPCSQFADNLDKHPYNAKGEELCAECRDSLIQSFGAGIGMRFQQVCDEYRP